MRNREIVGFLYPDGDILARKDIRDPKVFETMAKSDFDGGVEKLVRLKDVEQPPLSDDQKYKAELYDEVWAKATAMGFMNVTMALEKLVELLSAKCDTCGGQGEIPTGKIAYQGEWQPPEPVMERCPECGYGDEPAPAPAFAACLVECDACPASGGCVGTCMKAVKP